MAQFEPKIAELEKTGAQLVYIAAEKRQGMWKPSRFFDSHPVTAPFLLDEDRSVTKAYGLYHGFGTDAFNIARPATLVIDGAATVRYIYRGDKQTERAPIDEVMDAVRKISHEHIQEA